MSRSQRFRTRGARGLTVAALSLLGAGHAQAQGDTPAAQALFDEGKALMAKGQYEQACPKLEESQRLDPGLGTLFNLAECNEKTGRIATAWVRFLDVATGARSEGHREAQRVAQKRADALAPRLPKLVVEVSSPEKSPGLELLRDGVLVGAAQWGVAIPVDPGTHTVSASAPGRKAWEATVVASEKQVSKLSVPVLEAADVPAGSEAKPSASSPPSSAPAPVARSAEEEPAKAGGTQRTLGLVVGGVGIAGIGASLVLGALAKGQYDDAECPNDICSPAAGAERDGAWTKATISSIAFGVGAAALAGGAVLFFTAPSGDEKQATRPFSNLKVGIAPGRLVLRGNL
jgi:hypothetical protein